LALPLGEVERDQGTHFRHYSHSKHIAWINLHPNADPQCRESKRTRHVRSHIRTFILDISSFRAAQLPVIHVVRVYKADGSNVDLCRRNMVQSGKAIVQPATPGIELADALPPAGAAPLDPDLLLSGALQQLGECEWAMYKPRWGAFFHTRLEDHLRSLAVTTIAFTGCNFPNCPRTSIYEASERDFRVVLVEDAVSGIYDRGRDEVKSIGVSLMSSAKLAEAVSSCLASP
jgi:nicotinamidase-related amidase